MSERSLARLIFKESGMTFGRWRRRLHIVVALQRLILSVAPCKRYPRIWATIRSVPL